MLKFTEDWNDTPLSMLYANVPEPPDAFIVMLPSEFPHDAVAEE